MSHFTEPFEKLMKFTLHFVVVIPPRTFVWLYSLHTVLYTVCLAGPGDICVSDLFYLLANTFSVS